MDKTPKSKSVDVLTHNEATRKNIPTAEYQSVLQKDQQSPVQVAYAHRNRDLDPQLVWRGKDEQDWSDLVVPAPALYIQEKIRPKVLVDDLLRQTKTDLSQQSEPQLDLFDDFNGIAVGADKTEFYSHDQHWSNRMILGDSLQVMASLAEREGLRGQVQCIYVDPPYGIKFNSNFQWSTTSRDIRDGNAAHITREPEQVKAFRDTWRDGIHSYLTYLRDRLTVSRDLLTTSGSIFVQIGDENVHRVRALMDEVFGVENYVSTINFSTTGGLPSAHLSRIGDFILLYAKDILQLKWRTLKESKRGLGEEGSGYNRVEVAPFERRPAYPKEKADPATLDPSWRLYTSDNLNGQGSTPAPTPFPFQGKVYNPAPNSHWKANYPTGMRRLARASRIEAVGNNLRYVRYFDDNPFSPIKNIWLNTSKAGFAADKAYVVETSSTVIERCLLMTTDPGDLVLDPTCGSGTTATVAEQWARRWITIDTSRVALALSRARIMSARYPYYLLADSVEGKAREAELTGTEIVHVPPVRAIRHGFVYERAPHVQLRDIANNAEIDLIWERWERKIDVCRQRIRNSVGKISDEWDILRASNQNENTMDQQTLSEWRELCIARQREIDESIAAVAEIEFRYDKPYEDKKKVRVAGPFTVESISPHRALGIDENDEFIDPFRDATGAGSSGAHNFTNTILESLKAAGVQQARKDDKIQFISLTPWPGDLVCAEGRYLESGTETKVEKRAALFIGPEFGTLTRPDLVAAAREAGDADFDVLIACAFNYDAHTTEFNKLGRIPVLKARMNADLHMAADLKNTGAGNLFVIFGEPDIEILPVEDRKFRVKINGVDVFHPSSGTVQSDGADGIACWFIDTDYNEESFFVRHAYFLGANDPYSALKTTLKAEINHEAWASLNSNISRPFKKPASGRIAVKVINHLGDEVMKVFRINK